MAMFQIISSLLIFSLLSINRSQAAYNRSADACAFYRPDSANCRGSGTSDVTDYVGYFLDGRENYALISHPLGIYTLVDIDYVWYPSTEADIYINGVFAYIVNIQNSYYILTTVGCGQFIKLPNTPTLVPGTRTITYQELTAGLAALTDVHAVPCNVLTTMHIVGPFPSVTTSVAGANIVIRSSNLQSAIFYPQNGTNFAYVAGASRLAAATGLELSLTCGPGNTVLVVQGGAEFPAPPVCVHQSVNVFNSNNLISGAGAAVAAIESLGPNSACVLATVLAEALTNLNYSPSLYTYSSMVIYERDHIALVEIDGYIRTFFFENIFNTLFNSC